MALCTPCVWHEVGLTLTQRGGLAILAELGLPAPCGEGLVHTPELGGVGAPRGLPFELGCFGDLGCGAPQ